ncbi:hypothetical protein EMPS_09167 [Entomortierella parvispora]|uniref:Uncharacterized protein n=1 Tax=Entomortierella parvispora TaxID=205924 RepID=A0A9P3M019_9FUNG|nr:hypothetical protein EMPS_09167 [Entomortierella parvispora]
MRARSGILSVVGFAIFNALCAAATTGTFTYQTDEGELKTLVDPESGKCINLPDTTESPGHSPSNDTPATAIVFLEEHCDGDVYYVLGPSKKAGERLKVRSVIFS